MGLFGFFNRKQKRSIDSEERQMFIREFKEISAPFFEAGLLKTVYEDSYCNICNLANKSYVSFFYDMMCAGKENFVGILFHGKYLEQVVADPELVLQDFRSRPSQEKRDLMVPLNEGAFKIMEGMKENTDKLGPSSEIDLELEEKLINKETKMV